MLYWLFLYNCTLSKNVSVVQSIMLAYTHLRYTWDMAYTYCITWPDWPLKLYNYVHTWYLPSVIFQIHENSLPLQCKLMSLPFLQPIYWHACVLTICCKKFVHNVCMYAYIYIVSAPKPKWAKDYLKTIAPICQIRISIALYELINNFLLKQLLEQEKFSCSNNCFKRKLFINCPYVLCWWFEQYKNPCLWHKGQDSQ